MSMEGLREARYWEAAKGGRVQCLLCPQSCLITDGKQGLCGIRKNIDGRLWAMAYGIYPAVHMDPIEKKPLNHFLPGTEVLSIGSVGCNLTCRMCQNWSLSRSGVDPRSRRLLPDELLAIAGSSGSPSVAFTYNEPSINFEYIMEAAPMLRDKGIRTVLVTNGHLRMGPWKEMMGVIDAANIDIKGFSEEFYKRVAGGKLQPVLDNAKASFASGVHVEITYLVIPTENDRPDELKAFSDWVVRTLSPDLPVHFTRFHPDHQMMHLPPTPSETMEMAWRIGKEAGLTNIYIGNMTGKGSNDTVCPQCGTLLISRQGYAVKVKGVKDSSCSKCARRVYGVFR
jgi:pyruvate formate lyase activating enzyme